MLIPVTVRKASPYMNTVLVGIPRCGDNDDGLGFEVPLSDVASVLPEELPTAPGSIVELSGGFEWMRLDSKVHDCWIQLKTDSGVPRFRDENWIKGMGFTVVLDRGVS